MLHFQIPLVCFLFLAVSSHLVSDEKIDTSYPKGYFENCSNKMDPQTENLLNNINKSPPAFRLMTIEQLRQLTFVNPADLSKHPNIASIDNVIIQGESGPIGLRIYTPKTPSKSPLPVFIYLHGGGWILGNPDEFDSFNQEICQQAGCLFVFVDYGLSPEHPFPQPIEDCYLAAKWVEAHIKEYGGDPQRIAIGGDSAGANLTIAVTLRAREQTKPNFHCQILICPLTNYNFKTLSYYEFADGYFLGREDMKFFWDHYLGKNSKTVGKNPYVSPLLATSLAQLPTAYLLIANFDPLRDEGLAYGLRLHRSAVPTEIKRFNSIHGFYRFKELDLSREAISYISEKIKETFSNK